MLRQSTEWSGILLFGLVRCYLAFHTLIHCIAAWFVCKKKEFKIQMRTTSSIYSNLYFSSWIYCFEIHFYFFRLNDNDNHFVNKARWSSRKKFDFEKVVTIWSTACAYATHWILWLKHCVGRKALWTQHHFDGCIFGSAFIPFWHSNTQPHWNRKRKLSSLGDSVVLLTPNTHTPTKWIRQTQTHTQTHITHCGSEWQKEAIMLEIQIAG